MAFGTRQTWQLDDSSLTLMDHVAEGKFATIYKATWRHDGKQDTVAAKLLKRESNIKMKNKKKFRTVLSHWDFFHGKFGQLSPGQSQLRRSRATQPTVHAGCFIVSIIHRPLTWTTGSLTCTQILMHATDHAGVRTQKVDSGRNIPGRTGESNLHQRRAGQMLHQLNHIPLPH